MWRSHDIVRNVEPVTVSDIFERGDTAIVHQGLLSTWDDL